MSEKKRPNRSTRKNGKQGSKSNESSPDARERSAWDLRAEYLKRALSKQPPRGVDRDEATALARQLRELGVTGSVAENVFRSLMWDLDRGFSELIGKLPTGNRGVEPSEPIGEQLQRHYSQQKNASIEEIAEAAHTYFAEALKSEYKGKKLDHVIPDLLRRIDTLRDSTDPWEHGDDHDFRRISLQNYLDRSRRELTYLEQGHSAHSVLSAMEGTRVDPQEKIPDRTRDRAMLIVDYMFKYAEVETTQKRKSEAIALITGYSAAQINQSFSEFNDWRATYLEALKDANTDPTKAAVRHWNDLEFVRVFFLSLGMSHIAEIVSGEMQP